MKNKGFTLIELLAVLVVLSIIALVTIPAITGTLRKSKETLYNEQLKSIESAARLWGADNLGILPDDASSTNVCDYNQINDCPTSYRKLVIDLKMLQDNGYIDKNIKNPKTKEIMNNVIINIEKNENTVVYKVDAQENKYTEIVLNGADPVLNRDMVPVTITNDGIVIKANTKEKWYSYTEKEWANAVVLNDTTEYDAGDMIPEDNIKAYYVWIPRYSYKLFESSDPVEIDIAFESNYTAKKANTTVGEYYTHPAFTYGVSEISGFWVGKFETTGTNTVPTIKPYMSGNSNSSVKSLTNQKVSEQYTTAHLLSNNSRMMKNDEWGAVAYLSHSKYGINDQIRINNNSGYKTGCGASEDDKAASSSCEIEYGKELEYPQSTTGNITGVFDMSGGAWEYMMAVLADPDGKPRSGYTSRYYTKEQASDSTILGRSDNAAATTIWNSGFNGMVYGKDPDTKAALYVTDGTAFLDSKNYNLYDNPSNRNSINGDNGCNGSKCYGHAMTETKNWYGDYYYFPSVTHPWVLRGGHYSHGAYAGAFNANVSYGHAVSDSSFRVVVPAS